MRRTKEEAMKTRANIMDSAIEVFGEKNFASASVSEITSRIGLSKGAFYWHFKNKQDILLKIVEEHCNEGTEKTSRFYEGSLEKAGSIRAYYKEELANIKKDSRWQKLHKLMMRRHEWPDEMQERVQQIIQESMQRDIKTFETFIRKQQESGKMKESIPAGKAAMLFASVLHGLAILQISGILPEDFPESLDILFDALRREFCSDSFK